MDSNRENNHIETDDGNEIVEEIIVFDNNQFVLTTHYANNTSNARTITFDEFVTMHNNYTNDNYNNLENNNDGNENGNNSNNDLNNNSNNDFNNYPNNDESDSYSENEDDNDNGGVPNVVNNITNINNFINSIINIYAHEANIRRNNNIGINIVNNVINEMGDLPINNNTVNNENGTITIDTIRNEIAGILDNLTFEFSDYLQARIFDIQTNINPIDQDDIVIRNTVIISFIMNGLHNGHTLTELLNNICYNYLTYDVLNMDELRDIIMNNIPQTILNDRLNRNRSRFFVFLNNQLNNLNRDGQQQIKLTEIQFNEKFADQTFNYDDLEMENKTELLCSICHDNFEETKDMTFLNCNKNDDNLDDNLEHKNGETDLFHHCYHTNCIKEWMTGYSATCPLCKKSHA